MNKKSLTKSFEKIKLRELPFALFKLEKKIYNLLKQEESLKDDNQLKRSKYKRNLVRIVLLNRLLEWHSNPDKEKDWTYSEIMENENKKLQREQGRVR